jgi:hypothetical protein
MLHKMDKLFGRWSSGYYTYLLLFLMLIFAFRPFEKGDVYLGIWKTIFTLAILSALINVKHHRKVKIAAVICSIPVLCLSWTEFFFGGESFFVVNMMFTIAFLGVCTASILYDVILYARVTAETLRGVVCAYFLIAFLFAYIYYLIAYLIPESFLISNPPTLPMAAQTHHASVMMYFSFVTLLTIGFGDIVPLRDISQTFVILEGIIGQFYIAILVARIVAVYSFYYDKKLLENTIKRFFQSKEDS